MIRVSNTLYIFMKIENHIILLKFTNHTPEFNYLPFKPNSSVIQCKNSKSLKVVLLDSIE